MVRRAQQGDRDAYIELFGRFEADIYRMAFVYLNNQQDALDAVQETAYLSYRSITELKQPRYFKTWLLRIAIRCSINLLRQRGKTVFYHEGHIEALAVREDTPDIPLSLSVQELIGRLDEEEKSVILLRFYYDYTIKEASGILDIPLGTAKTVLYRALGKLRKLVKEGGWDDNGLEKGLR